MSESKEQQTKVESTPLIIALLDEIAERLLALETHNKEISPEGIVEPLPILSVTTVPLSAQPPFANMGKYWFSVSIINEGPQHCWAIINTGKSSTRPHKIASDGVYEISFTKALIYDMRFYTDTGTASLNITGSR